MIRVVAAAIFLLSFPISSFAQTQPGPEETTQRAAPAAKPGAKKLAPIPNIAARSTKPAESRSCQIGVNPIAGNLFLVEKFGPLTFTDTYERVSVDGWALDELVVSRVRAAAPGTSVRRIPSPGRSSQTTRSPFHASTATRTSGNSLSTSPAE